MALLFLAACASSPDYAAEPGVLLDSLEPGEEPGTVSLQFVLKNPADVMLPVSALRYRLDIEGSDFAWGVSRQAVNVPGGGEAVFSVTVPGRLPVPVAGQTRLNYTLTGTVYLAGRSGELKFNSMGVLNPLDLKTP